MDSNLSGLEVVPRMSRAVGFIYFQVSANVNNDYAFVFSPHQIWNNGKIIALDASVYI